MNIFFLNPNPDICAQMHIDKHVVKMILEYGQLMSTAHRVLDGQQYTDKTANGRCIQRWRLSDHREDILWKASHIKHPSGLWVRASKTHYDWLYSLWLCLLQEYTHRYDRFHSAERMKFVFAKSPHSIPSVGWVCDPTPAMPDEYKVKNDSITSYQNYYNGAKISIAKWTKRKTPLFVTFKACTV
jgi:hypothetical protein